MKKILATILLAAFCAQLGACAAAPQESKPNEPTLPTGEGTTLLVDAPTQKPALPAPGVDKPPVEADFSAAAAEFSIALLQHVYQDGDTCILSPYSALFALALAANGANGQTLSQMETALGMPLDALNEALLSLRQNAGSELISANSIWYRDGGVSVQEAFLRTNEVYFGAQAYPSAFDQGTLAAANQWVSENTKGRIENILSEIDPSAMLYLINALSFDATWEHIYEEGSSTESIFRAADGAQQDVTLMHSQESRYLDDGKATGFIKDYEGGKYSFIALLPNETVPMEDYVASLSGEGLMKTIDSATAETVNAWLPRFHAASQFSLNNALAAMGMTDAFDPAAADFSAMARSDAALFISSVLQKTDVTVDESGTRAGAATAIIVMKSTAISNPKTVRLDRPFVMGIVDNETGALIFFGVVNSITDPA